MPVQDMLNDRQPQPGATDFTRRRIINTVKSLGQPGQVFLGDAFTLIALSAVACLLVGLSGLVTPAFRGLSLPPVDLES